MRKAMLLFLPMAVAAAAPEGPPKLLVLGVSHFGNPGRDMVNPRVEDVLTPDRQVEIAAVVDALAATRPTHVAVEWPAAKQAALDQLYADYRAGRHPLARDETEQIGLRLAARLNLPRVDAVDWNEEPPGKDADYDFAAWAAAHGRKAELDAITADTARYVARLDALNRCRTIAGWLRDLNTPAYEAWDNAIYYRIATMGDAAANPGAAWVGAWYARNLRIAAALRTVAGRPGDRTVAVFGAGHAGLLRRYAAGMGFTIADTGAALPPSARVRCKGGY